MIVATRVMLFLTAMSSLGTERDRAIVSGGNYALRGCAGAGNTSRPELSPPRMAIAAELRFTTTAYRETVGAPRKTICPEAIVTL